jgi:hypothetical protein
MKKFNSYISIRGSILVLIATTLLLQSCFSYKVADINSNPAIGEKYKIKQSTNYEKVKVLSATDSSITVINNNKESTIAKKDIKIIKKRHYSVIKTALLPGIALILIIIIAIASDNLIHIGAGSIQMPP